MKDLIDRQAAIDSLWKALYEYEDKTEKQFQESDELDVGDWILHREFVQNMSDIDRRTILDLPSAQPEIVRCEDCRYANECHKSVQYTRNEPNSTTIGYSPIEWCSRGKRRIEN